MMLKYVLAVAVFLCCYHSSVNAQTTEKVHLFSPQQVQLLNSDFKEAEETDLQYILSLDADKLLAPYLREAGLPAKSKRYGNWESDGLDGHIAGHYLSALALMYAANGNSDVKERLDYSLKELQKCQDKNANGYLGGVPGSKVFWDKIAAGEVDKIGEKWVPFYNIHKMFAGLRDAWLYTHHAGAKEMLVKFADWYLNIIQQLSDEQIEKMLKIEHGGISEVLADVADITGDKKYLAGAYQYSQKSILNFLANGEDKLDNLHANTQIPKIIGYKRISELNGDSVYLNASRFFWETVTNNRTVAIGGNSVREHFNPLHNFSSMMSSEQGPETCNTYNMLKLTKMLFKTYGDEKFIQFYERALYNHILSSQHPQKGGFVYFTPMRPGHYRVYSQPETSMWCCVGSGIENHAKYNELIYAYSNEDVYINLFIPSVLNWEKQGLILTQQTKFPEEEKTELLLNLKKSKRFALKIRIRQWVVNNSFRILVNGKSFSYQEAEGSYISINRKWKNGDKVLINFAMKTSTEKLPDHSDYVALLKGPIVLASKIGTEDMEGLFADDSRFGHVANGKQYPLAKMPFFITDSVAVIPFSLETVAEKPLHFTATSLIYPAKYKQLELMPFYKLHDARYIIYWPVAKPSQLPAKLKLLEEEGKAEELLNLKTIDWVQPGEQQPESDHYFKSEQSESGVFKGLHWRSAKKWFSYNLIVNKEANTLSVMYYGRDFKKNFQIFINDTLLATENFNTSKGDRFYTIDYPIPQDLKAEKTWVVKFLANNGSGTAQIYQVRLLK